jgi:hypothetical protein
MDADTKQALEALETRIMARFDQSDERIRDVETRLLSAFHGWSRPIEAGCGISR